MVAVLPLGEIVQPSFKSCLFLSATAGLIAVLLLEEEPGDVVCPDFRKSERLIEGPVLVTAPLPELLIVVQEENMTETSKATR